MKILPLGHWMNSIILIPCYKGYYGITHQLLDVVTGKILHNGVKHSCELFYKEHQDYIWRHRKQQINGN